MTLSIKNLTDISQSEWMILWKAYQAFYKTTLSEEVNANTWRRLTDPKVQEMYGFAALIDQRVVGIVHVVEHLSCWTLEPYAYLQDLFTLDEYRGQGVAKALIRQIETFCKQRKCDRVYWLTHQDNLTAQKLYDRIATKTGFIQYRLAT